MNNPLLTRRDTPFGIPPFDKIETGHLIPALQSAIESAREEVAAITVSGELPDFRNSVEALEYAGRKVSEIAALIFNLNMAETDSSLQKAAMEASGMLTRFSNEITLNSKLFQKFRGVERRGVPERYGTAGSQLLRKKIRDFILGGASLTGRDREKFEKITEQLSALSLRFEENLLAATNEYEMHITSPGDLEGLPASLTEAAEAEAESRGKKGWVFTLHQPGYMPFMQYSARRDLRKELFMAYSTRAYGDNNRNNNSNIVRDIVNLRLELANLLGYKRYSDMILEERMAGSTEGVNSFLEKLLVASSGAARRDIEEVTAFANANGHRGNLERYDWPYWSERLKMDRFRMDDELLRPWFPLERCEEAVLSLASALYNIRFRHRPDIPAYHNDVKVFEVTEPNGEHLALLMADYHPRSGKSGGAWMTSYREQHHYNGTDIRPVISVVANFTPATRNRPSLLTHNELTTLMHEFGHALHGIFSKVPYETISGTNVARDFVELPSQLMENWAYESSWLNKWARHYITGAPLPKETMETIRALRTFNEGYATFRQLSFGLLDMAWHTLDKPFEGDIEEFETRAMAPASLFRDINGTCMSCSFGHLFSGGYAAGYYGYKWAEVLDADAWSLFKEQGITGSKAATLFREHILEKGGSEKASTLYRNFRGREPSIKAFLSRSGFSR
jgi:peptidyl-dipeptidase Dcp